MPRRNHTRKRKAQEPVNYGALEKELQRFHQKQKHRRSAPVHKPVAEHR